MKKMFVRIIALVLSLLMVSAVFLGCNNEESKDSDGENQETPGASAPAETQDTTPMLDDSKFNIYYKAYV